MTGNRNKTSFDLFKYCPVCKGPLSEADSADIFIRVLQCNSNHSFHVPKSRVLTADTGRKYKKLSYDSNDKMLTIQKWLGDPAYRSHLNDQMAEILRLLIEMSETTYNKQAQKERKISFCPFCGEMLKRRTELDNVDIYSKALTCVHGHNFSYRNCLMVHEGDEHLELCQDMDSVFLLKSADEFIEKRGLRKYLPDQIIELVKCLLEREKAKSTKE